MINFNDKFKSVIKQAQNKIVNYQLLQADNLASNKNYQLAILLLEKIPLTSDTYTEAQKKLVEYRNAFAVNLFQEAVNKSNTGFFIEALASLKRIPEKTQVYAQAQEKIRDCEKAIRQQQQEQEKILIEQAANYILEKNFDKAITILKRIPKTSELYADVQQKIVVCEEGIKQQNLAKQREQEERLLEQAANYAASYDFNKAITTLEGIPKTSEIFTKVQQKITEYRDSFAVSLIQQGLIKYKNGHFAEAITAYKLVPEGTLTYHEAQDKIKECEEAIKQQLIVQQLETQKHEFNRAINLANINKFEEAIINLAKISVGSELYQQAQAKITEYQQKIEEERKKRQAEAGGRAIEVVQIYEQNGLLLKNSMWESIDGRMVVVVMDFSNTSKKSGNFLFSQFQLIDSNRNTYNELSDMTYSLWRQEKGFGLRSDEYFPGEIRQDAAVFRVSPTAKDFTLKWNGKTIKLWL